MSQQLLIPPHKLPAAYSITIVRKDDLCLALFSVAGALHATDDSCPHSGASLVMGKLAVDRQDPGRPALISRLQAEDRA